MVFGKFSRFFDYGITDSSNCDVTIDGQTVVLGFPDDRGRVHVLSLHGPGWRAETGNRFTTSSFRPTLFEFNITEDTNELFCL